MDLGKLDQKAKAAVRKRLERGETYRSLAPVLGISPAWLNKWVNGKIYNPGLYTIERLLDGLRE